MSVEALITVHSTWFSAMSARLRVNCPFTATYRSDYDVFSVYFPNIEVERLERISKVTSVNVLFQGN